MTPEKGEDLRPKFMAETMAMMIEDPAVTARVNKKMKAALGLSPSAKLTGAQILEAVALMVAE